MSTETVTFTLDREMALMIAGHAGWTETKESTTTMSNLTPEETRALFTRLHADRGRWHDRGLSCHDAYCVQCYEASSVMFGEAR